MPIHFDLHVRLYADDAAIEDPGGARFVGGEQLMAHLDRLIEAFPDIRHEVIHTLETETAAAVQGRITGTHIGPLASRQGRSRRQTARSICASPSSSGPTKAASPAMTSTSTGRTCFASSASSDR